MFGEREKYFRVMNPVTQSCREIARERLSLRDLPQGALRKEQVVVPEALLGQEPVMAEVSASPRQV